MTYLSTGVHEHYHTALSVLFMSCCGMEGVGTLDLAMFISRLTDLLWVSI